MRCKGKTQTNNRCQRKCENGIYCWQHNQIGGNNESITFHCYIQLSGEQNNYSRDTQKLVTNYKQIDRYADNKFVFAGKPKTKHITILDFDIIMDDQAIRRVSRYKLADFKLADGTVDKRNFGRFRQQIFGQIKGMVSQTIKGLFKNYPNDTTASLYPSRYDKKGPFVAVIFRTDLAFIDLIIPAIQGRMQQYALNNQFQIQISQFFIPLNNIILHMSLGKENQAGQSVSQQPITSDVAKNYAVSKQNIDSLLMIEGTSTVTIG